MKKIYHYHPETREFIGEGVADPSPINPETPIIPAFATDIEPPSVDAKHKAVFNGGKWIVKVKLTKE